MPSYSGDMLSFDSKYRVGGKGGSKGLSPKGATKGGGSSAGMASLNRTIPAPISAERTAEAQTLAKAAFDALGCDGVARVDFLLDQNDKLFFNEINTVPGSLAYYLWEASGVRFDQLVTKLVDGALARHESRRRTQFSMDANLLGAAR
jgi:D-alanine-D-alanine ligase